MHKARAFFFVCAGISLLALSYHLGARSAGAQVGSGVDCVNVHGSGANAVINWYYYGIGGGVLNRISVPVPGKAVACGDNGRVILDTGQQLVYDAYGAGAWRTDGAFPFSNPTPAQSISIGQLKARYAK